MNIVDFQHIVILCLREIDTLSKVELSLRQVRILFPVYNMMKPFYGPCSRIWYNPHGIKEIIA